MKFSTEVTSKTEMVPKTTKTFKIELTLGIDELSDLYHALSQFQVLPELREHLHERLMAS